MSDFPPFVPHFFLRTVHLQTVFSPHLPGQLRPYRAQQHIVVLPDEDKVVMHDDCPPQWEPGDRVALLLHGVTGCHGSPYLVRLAGKLNDVGVRTFRMDMRGCGAGMKLAQHPGHAGRSEDARACVEQLAQLCPHSPCSIVGFSLGGNIALKLLGEAGSDLPGNLDSGVAVSAPIDLVACGRNIDRGWNAFYSRKFAHVLTQFVKDRLEFMPAAREINLRPAPRSIVDFDNRVTAPLSGFEGVWDYYRQCSSAPLLSNIATPTLVITSADDSMIPVTMYERASVSRTVKLVITSHGGHVGFYAARNSDPDRWWIDWRIIDWMQSQHSAALHSTNLAGDITV